MEDKDEALAGQFDQSGWPARKAALAELFARRPRDTWAALVEPTDACAAPVLSLAEAPDHPHNRARGTFIDVGGVTQPAPAPPRFSATPSSVQGAPRPAGAGHRGGAGGLGGGGDWRPLSELARGLADDEAQRPPLRLARDQLQPALAGEVRHVHPGERIVGEQRQQGARRGVLHPRGAGAGWAWGQRCPRASISITTHALAPARPRTQAERFAPQPVGRLTRSTITGDRHGPRDPVGRGNLRLSLVTCPVALYTASTRAGDVSFHLLNPETGNRIRMVTTDPDSGPVERSSLVKGYEVSKDQYVILKDEEIKAVRLESTKVIEIERFVAADEIDRLYWNDPYFLTPSGDIATEAFTVIREAMRENRADRARPRGALHARAAAGAGAPGQGHRGVDAAHEERGQGRRRLF